MSAVSYGRLSQKTVCILKREKECGFMEIVDLFCSRIVTIKKGAGKGKVVKSARRTTGKPSKQTAGKPAINMTGRLFKIVFFAYALL